MSIYSSLLVRPDLLGSRKCRAGWALGTETLLFYLPISLLAFQTNCFTFCMSRRQRLIICFAAFVSRVDPQTELGTAVVPVFYFVCLISCVVLYFVYLIYCIFHLSDLLYWSLWSLINILLYFVYLISCVLSIWYLVLCLVYHFYCYLELFMSIFACFTKIHNAKS